MDRSIFGQLFDYGVDILVTTLGKATGVITAQLGDSTAGKPDSDNAEWWQQPGFASRPALPTNGGASCQGIVLKSGDRDIVIAARDTRGTAIVGNLSDGETCVYASAGQAACYFKKDGSARLMTTDNNQPPGAKGASGPTGNAIQSGISSYYQTPTGPKLGGEWRYAAPWGGAWHDPTGYHLRTWHGVKVDAGGVVLPSPLSISGSSHTTSADTIALDGANVILGRNTGTGQSLLQALPVQAQLGSAITSLATATQALAAAVAAFTGTGTFPGIAAAQINIGTALSAISAAVTALTTTCATRATTAS